MKRVAYIILFVAILAASALWIITQPRMKVDLPEQAYAPDLQNGERMFNVSGCASCHQKSKDEPNIVSGGHAIKSPFGTFYAPNITPHPTAGIGAWSEQDFIRAMRYGSSPMGEHYYPAFPYASYQAMALNDIRDLFTYIKTLPQDATPSKPHDVAFPFNIRESLGGWKLLFLKDQPFTASPEKSELWNLGAYLANAPGHCAECHTPRNPLGGLETHRQFQGADMGKEGGKVPAINAERMKKYSEEEIYEMLTTGFTPEFDVLGGEMAHVVRNLSKLPERDRRAIAHYLKNQ